MRIGKKDEVLIMPIMIIEKNMDFYKYQDAIINKSKQFVISSKEVVYPSENPFAVLKAKNSSIKNSDVSDVKEQNQNKKENINEKIIKEDVLDSIYFDFDKYNIKKSELSKLNSIINTLKKKYQDKTIKVVGYTDWFGKERYNNTLAQNRAYQVALILWKAGLNVKPEGKGKCCYVDKLNPALNRRVEIIVNQ